MQHSMSNGLDDVDSPMLTATQTGDQLARWMPQATTISSTALCGRGVKFQTRYTTVTINNLL